MDEEMRAYLDAQFASINQKLDAARAEFNDAQERILNRLNALEQDFHNTKGFLVSDAVVSGRRWFDHEERLGRIEQGRKP